MGGGIAQVAARAGFSVILYEVNGVVLQHAQESLHEDLKKLVTKGKLSNDEKDALVWRSTSRR